jgi:hypothetical protein
MSSAPTATKTTLWIWPSGLFPRRLVYYFRAKHITLSILKDHNIHLVPVALNTDPPALVAMPGHETRPADTSLPVLRITLANGKKIWIRDSLSILSYFESLFPSSAGWPDLLGETPEDRAHTSDVLSLLSDAMHWSLVCLINCDPKTTFWSGLKGEDMSSGVAEHAKGRWRFHLDRLGRWLQDDDGQVMQRDTIAGVVLLAQVEYHDMMCGADWVEGNAVLRKWVESMKGEAWYVESRVLKGVEEGVGWELVLRD